MGKFIDLTGRRFGKLVVVKRERSESTAAAWDCLCDCGTSKTVKSSNLNSGGIKSCGCLWFSHRQRKTKEYAIWAGMLARCRNPNVDSYPRYGGRGIKVCERWVNFVNFYADLGPRPSNKYSLERENSDGNYEPGNVRWATAIEQANNKRNTRYVIYQGKQMPLADAVRAAGSVIHIEAAWIRISKSGWSVGKALETPRTMESRASKSRRVA